MTTMDYEELIGLGFNKNEAKVYLSLITFGKADANRIIKDTKFHKNIVYDNLEKLMDKGLVTYIIEEGRKVFQIAPPDMLVKFFEEQEKEIEKRKKSAAKIAEEIRKTIKKIPKKQEATIYKGVKAIKSFFNEVLRNKKDFAVFGAPQASVDILGEHFWKNYELKRVENKINVRMIANPSVKEFAESLKKIIKNKYTLVRYFEQNFEPLTETHIEKDQVAFIVWSDTPVLFLIQDQLVADSYKAFFEKMWKQAKP